mmetsp:Transcript_25489/g.49973  ORF Transcript_25489/g.49973 Transcript_25489/m.49973 type:complete len:282 (-) Transcript_25489:122-967(-)|eukprot:CAMPEP_0172660350 /NCGR_PEP_ID=MMETSP1074-20121228/4019_1 /TAXON_ID=2916 /ORGANISM="Ceratium fusus, Strain PA161109" /LENGTH=281 /DNA_ID=CAMNT_0013475963 /DNA_START=78 /DNA_END=923 /DNA_ORIENTATION=+
MAGLLARFRGDDVNPLASDLRKATESGVIEVPKDLVRAVVTCSHNEEDRRLIMRHIRECLAEPSAIKWRRTFAALILVEDLLKNGAQELFDETAEGHHFDLVQRLSLLEKFECTTDKRVQNMVRSKASGMRAEVVSRLQTAGEGSSATEANCDRASTFNPGTAPSTCSTAASGSIGSNTSSSESGGAPWKPQGQMVLNGIVAVGHTDDTTSESSGDEATRRKAVEFRPVRVKKGARKPQAKGSRSRDQSDSETSGSDRGRRQAPKAATSAPPEPEVDLLGL